MYIRIQKRSPLRPRPNIMMMNTHFCAPPSATPHLTRPHNNQGKFNNLLICDVFLVRAPPRCRENVLNQHLLLLWCMYMYITVHKWLEKRNLCDKRDLSFMSASDAILNIYLNPERYTRDKFEYKYYSKSQISIYR